MNTPDPDLEHRLDLLRTVAAPATGDKQRVLASIRRALEASEAEPRDARGPAARARPAGAASGLPWRWLSGALAGGAVGLAIGFNWARAGLVPALAEAPITSAPDERRVVLASNEIEPLAQTLRSATGGEPLEPPASPPLASLTASRGASSTLGHVTTPRARFERGARTPASPPGSVPMPRAAFDLTQTLELLQQAEQALHAAEPELALGFLSDLDRGAPRDTVREERLTTRALALCQLERSGEAQAARRELESEFPRSIYLNRLDQSCAQSNGLAVPRRGEKSP